jgi:RNA polymerase sigma-70 factor (ECF subfamily)
MKPMDRATSLTLLERIRDRDQEAWRRLVHIYGPLVAHWCAAKGIRGPDVEDVQQEVFRAVAGSLGNFRRDRAGDTFRGWLRGITRNKIVDLFRRQQSQPVAQGGTDSHRHLEQIPEAELPEDSEEELGGLYRRALELVRSEFEDRTWTAFWRAAVEGHDVAVIAADLGVTPAAVRKAKSRVLHRLRQEIGDVID